MGKLVPVICQGKKVYTDFDCSECDFLAEDIKKLTIRVDGHEVRLDKDEADIASLETLVNNIFNKLQNYYTTDETYSQEEVNELLSSMESLHIHVVDELPEEGVDNAIYLVPSESGSGVYNQYVYSDGAWKKIGNTDVDLSEYVTKQGLVDMIYPVGAVYMSMNSADPANLFGGSWERLENRFLIGASVAYPAGDIGGEATVRLTSGQSGLPAHVHGFTQPTVNGGAVTNAISGGGHTHSVQSASDRSDQLPGTNPGDYGPVWRTPVSGGSVATERLTGAGTHTHNLPAHTHAVSGGAVGNATAQDAAADHNNIPPYLSVYMWRRIA